jgi:hypothetical protein
MLRGVVLAFAILATFTGLYLLFAGITAPGIYALALGVVITLGTLFERWRYRQTDRQLPDAGWKATGERFVDPSSGKNIEVFYDPSSGERRYVER